MEYLTLTNIMSWVACILLLVGLKLIGDKRHSGFYIASLAEIIWIVWGMLTHSYALVAMSVVIMAMYARAIWLWKKSYDNTYK